MNAQNHNRYSYCLNSPLKFTDPSGYRFHMESQGPREFNPTNNNSFFYDNVNKIILDGSSSNFYPNISGGSYNNWVNGGVWDIDIENDIAMLETLIAEYFQNEFKKAFNFVAYYTGYEDPPQSTGGEPLPLWTGWANNGVNAAAYGAYEVGGTFRLMKGGSLSLQHYASGWVGGSRAKISTYSLSKLGSGIGYDTSFLGVIMGGYNFAVSDKSWGDYGQLGVSVASSVLTCFPATTPLGIGIGVIDLTGGFNGFYQGLDANQQLYNSTGFVMIPTYMGVPTLLKLK